jgi:hypothetical protein
LDDIIGLLISFVTGSVLDDSDESKVEVFEFSVIGVGGVGGGVVVFELEGSILRALQIKSNLLCKMAVEYTKEL